MYPATYARVGGSRLSVNFYLVTFEMHVRVCVVAVAVRRTYKVSCSQQNSYNRKHRSLLYIRTALSPLLTLESEQLLHCPILIETMISCVEWVPKGVADPTPKKYELSPAERELIEQQANTEAALDEDDDDDDDDAYEEPATSKVILPTIDPKSLPADLRMDEYSDDEDNDAKGGAQLGKLLVGRETDEEGNLVEDVDPDYDSEEEDDDDGVKTEQALGDSDSDNDEDDDDLADIPDTREYMPVDVEGLEAMGLSAVSTNGAMYSDNLGEEFDDDDSDNEDLKLSSDDAIIVIAKTEEDFASLEVHVYEEKTGNLFIHHDIPLPSFPLCLAHGDINSDGKSGNYCAVGSFGPGIEVWNLDVLNALEPSCILGGEDTTAADDLMKANMARAASGKKLKKKKLQQQGLRPGSHTDAVMCLSWNKVHRQVLASGSADCTVKIWDITKAGDPNGKSNAATFCHHKDKVQSVKWHPTEGTLLATGSYDRTVALLDARVSEHEIKKVKISADCESLSWDPHHSQYLTCATEDGVVCCWDVRKFDSGKPLWSFVAEEYGGVSDLSYNPNVPGLLATCAINKTVTLWDTYANAAPSGVAPIACGNKDMQVGKLYTISFYPSSPWLLGCGGSGSELALWEISSEAAVMKRFGDRVKARVAVSKATDDEPKDEPDFEAMMATRDAETERKRDDFNNKKPKQKGKGKKKVHRQGR
jgi:periodic tryptophan protein 1